MRKTDYHATAWNRIWRPLGVLAALAVTATIVLVAPGFAQARVIKIQITSVESPAFGGTSFGAVGRYEKLRGTITGLVDRRTRRTRSSLTSRMRLVIKRGSSSTRWTS